MIFLPPSFDYMLFFSDYFQIATPFVVIASLFAGYRHLKKAGNNI